MSTGNVNNSPNSAAASKVRVMIVDDSALMRKLLTQVLQRDPGLEVVETAMDGQFALDKLQRARPDVVLLDVDMPRLDGLATLDRLVADFGLPVVMCSTSTRAGAEATIQALKRGAVDFIEKPSMEALTTGRATAEIAGKLREAVNARVRVARRPATVAAEPRPEPVVQAPAPSPVSHYPRTSIDRISAMAVRAVPELMAIGTSTGGPPALEQALTPLPANFPLGIVIVQHMPPGFTEMLAQHLDRVCAITVREAAEGDQVRPGTALIAPGGKHLRVARGRDGYVVSLDDQTGPVSGHRPSVDVLFDSVAAASRGHAAAVIMTGMGSDGAEGLGRLSRAGAVTIAQTPDSCICHGMPKSSIDRGYAQAIVPLEEIASAILACGPVTSKHSN
ncbi:MAG: chemotaxis response regulator protein-glutamate methylesterase [Blastocatellia bacterium]